MTAIFKVASWYEVHIMPVRRSAKFWWCEHGLIENREKVTRRELWLRLKQYWMPCNQDAAELRELLFSSLGQNI